MSNDNADGGKEPNMIVPPPIAYEDRISLVADPNIKYLDTVSSDIFEKWGMGRLGGASGRGWSSYQTFMRCPYLFKIKYLDGIRGLPAMALELGSAFHSFLALHYRWMRDEKWELIPQIFKDELLAGGVRPQPVLEAWRLYEAYALHYENDYIIPLEEEYWAEDPDGNTCRYDLIARVPEGVVNVPAGAWIIEHKSAARFTGSFLDGWKNDGEVLGQIMVWKRAGLDKKFGKLQGNIVNIVGKQKIIQFHRTIVPAQRWHVQQHMADLKVWSALQRICEATDTWPRSRANCTTKFGNCDNFENCSDNLKPVKVERLMQKTKSVAEQLIGITGRSSIPAATTSPLLQTTPLLNEKEQLILALDPSLDDKSLPATDVDQSDQAAD
jgi:hypothetical protein